MSHMIQRSDTAGVQQPSLILVGSHIVQVHFFYLPCCVQGGFQRREAWFCLCAPRGRLSTMLGGVRPGLVMRKQVDSARSILQAGCMHAWSVRVCICTGSTCFAYSFRTYVCAYEEQMMPALTTKHDVIAVCGTIHVLVYVVRTIFYVAPLPKCEEATTSRNCWHRFSTYKKAVFSSCRLYFCRTTVHRFSSSGNGRPD